MKPDQEGRGKEGAERQRGSGRDDAGDPQRRIRPSQQDDPETPEEQVRPSAAGETPTRFPGQFAGGSETAHQNEALVAMWDEGAPAGPPGMGPQELAEAADGKAADRKAADRKDGRRPPSP